MRRDRRRTGAASVEDLNYIRAHCRRVDCTRLAREQRPNPPDHQQRSVRHPERGRREPPRRAQHDRRAARRRTRTRPNRSGGARTARSDRTAAAERPRGRRCTARTADRDTAGSVGKAGTGRRQPDEGGGKPDRRRRQTPGCWTGKFTVAARVGRPSAEGSEIARLRRQLEVTQHRLFQTEAALDIMGKARALGGDLRERAGAALAQAALMGAHRELRGAGVTTRAAARLTGVSRATTGRKPRTPAAVAGSVAPANRLSAAERTRVLAVLDSPRFVDQPPLQVYAALLDEGVYLCSVSTMYRILAEHRQVKDRRRQARHPPRAVPELVATGPGQVYCWDITKLAGPVKGAVLRRLRDDRHLLPLHRRRARPRPRVRGAGGGDDEGDLRYPRASRRSCTPTVARR